MRASLVILLLLCLVLATILFWRRDNAWLEAHAISLPREHARQAALKRRFAGQGIRVRFFPAVDTRNGRWNRYVGYLTEKGQRALARTVRTGVRRDHAELTPGAVGCFLSHLTLWEKLATKNRVSLVLEDDSDPIPAFQSHLRVILNHFPEDADVFLLSYQVMGTLIPVTSLPYRCFLLSRASTFFQTNCYLISPAGILKILAYFRNVKKSRFEVQVDAFLSDMIHNGLLRVYASETPLCPQDTAFPTTIQGFEVV